MRQLLAFGAYAKHGKVLAVEGPQSAVFIKLQALHQVRGALGPEYAFFIQVAVVLDDSPVAGMIIVRVI